MAPLNSINAVLLSFWLFTSGIPLARAEIGVADNEIRIGQSIGLTGPVADLAAEYQRGARLYFDKVNSQGGIYGRKIRLISIDDGYNPERGVANTKNLIENEKVFAFFGQFGTGVAQATLPIITGAGIPLFAMASGASSLRNSSNRYLFNIRASYEDEARRIIEHLLSLNIQDIGVAYQNDGFGKDGLEGIKRALAQHNLQPTTVASIGMPEGDVRHAISAIGASHPSAIILIAAGKASVEFVRGYRKLGHPAQYLALSVVSSKYLIKQLGSEAHGIVISQVMPSPWHTSDPLVREYQNLFSSQQHDEYSYSSFETFVSAKIFVEVLRRAGKDLTRDKFIAAAESMTNVSFGDLAITFGPAKHDGSSYVDLTIIGRNGQFFR